MSKRAKLAIFMAAQFVATDYAMAAYHQDEPKNSRKRGLFTSQNQSQALVKDQWYELNKSIPVTVMEAVGGEANLNVNGKSSLFLVEGTEVNIMDYSPDKQFAFIGMDEGGEVVHVWVRVSELMRGQPEYIDVEGIEIWGDAVAYDQDEYVSTDVARRGGGQARRRGGRRGGRRGMTFCLRDVRLAAPRYTCKRRPAPSVERASLAYNVYKSAGWSEYHGDISSAPLGTACFSDGGRMDCGPRDNEACGHAAIKTAPNTWKGAGKRPSPWLNNGNGKVYVKQGCLTPPTC